MMANVFSLSNVAAAAAGDATFNLRLKQEQQDFVRYMTGVADPR